MFNFLNNLTIKMKMVGLAICGIFSFVGEKRKDMKTDMTTIEMLKKAAEIIQKQRVPDYFPSRKLTAYDAALIQFNMKHKHD